MFDSPNIKTFLLIVHSKICSILLVLLDESLRRPVVQAALRPDIVLCSNEAKKIIIIKLPTPEEEELLRP